MYLTTASWAYKKDCLAGGMIMKKCHIIILLLIFMTLNSNIVYANDSYSARFFSMGGACVGLVNDYNAIFDNPAGLADNDFAGINFGLTRILNKHDLPSIVSLEKGPELFVGNYGSVSALKFASLGFGFSETNYADISLDDMAFTRGIEKSYNLAYGRPILRPFANIGALAWGINFCHFTRDNFTYSLSDPDNILLTKQDKATGNTIDFGVMVKATNIINLGLKVDNLVSKIKWQESGLDKLPQTITFGMAINVPVLNMTFATDLAKTKSIPEACLKMGIEKHLFLNALALRAGFTKANKEDILYTGGLGLNLGPFKADLGLGVDNTPEKNIVSLLGLKIEF